MALKFFTAPFVPNPDVVEMYLHETGRQNTVSRVSLDLVKGENHTDRNPNVLGEVPCLVLADGTPLSESASIVKYLDEIHGATSIVGTSPQERALTDMWLKRVETKIEGPLGEAFRSGPLAKFFESRRPGYVQPANVPGWRAAGQAGLKWLNGLLADNRSYLCGDRFSLADIRLYCNVSFYLAMDPDQSVPPQLERVHAYMARIAARPSAAAIAPPKKSKL
mmetsp:Transcript_1157/g.2486  ORF Transcript_1157/g.2486 Transcript_1157/m.2486 type:complete len:221 (-) Transcript_1157:31-693(-)|eukprot:CAMPEP_0171100218 /NCGR_PEP_ID=MMETSP0766_2-20121228/52829_1 /TAXON_ID=439317 /ORGANISM="Gambierdiscus australes, Strain CAWD 149" /LENGTH=220 /DNA_ID=CAMNT_0011560005 /DNA_START=51 /DNA_END=713 /DNA_ORIENTATION=+